MKTILTLLVYIALAAASSVRAISGCVDTDPCAIKRGDAADANRQIRLDLECAPPAHSADIARLKVVRYRRDHEVHLVKTNGPRRQSRKE